MPKIDLKQGDIFIHNKINKYNPMRVMICTMVCRDYIQALSYDGSLHQIDKLYIFQNNEDFKVVENKDLCKFITGMSEDVWLEKKCYGEEDESDSIW